MNPNTHFYLYAKGFYEKGNVVSDLKSIMAEYTGLKFQFVSEGNVIERLLHLAWYEMNKSGNPENNFFYFCHKVNTGGNRNLINACLDLLKLSDVSKEKLGRPDENILPLDFIRKKEIDDFSWSK